MWSKISSTLNTERLFTTVRSRESKDPNGWQVINWSIILLTNSVNHLTKDEILFIGLESEIKIWKFRVSIEQKTYFNLISDAIIHIVYKNYEIKINMIFNENMSFDNTIAMLVFVKNNCNFLTQFLLAKMVTIIFILLVSKTFTQLEFVKSNWLYPCNWHCRCSPIVFVGKIYKFMNNISSLNALISQRIRKLPMKLFRIKSKKTSYFLKVNFPHTLI